MRVDSNKHASPVIPDSRGLSFEVTGFGVIAALMIAFWSLVADGTLPLSQYLAFLTFLLVSLSALICRVVMLAPVRKANRTASNNRSFDSLPPK